MPSYIVTAPEDILMVQQLPGQSLTMIRVDNDGGGDRTPTITMRPGEVRRWRIINGSPFDSAFVSLAGDTEGLELYQIAYDGLTLPRRLPVDLADGRDPWENPFALAPGNRTDMMVRALKDAAGKRYSISALHIPAT